MQEIKIVKYLVGVLIIVIGLMTFNLFFQIQPKECYDTEQLNDVYNQGMSEGVSIFIEDLMKDTDEVKLINTEQGIEIIKDENNK